MDIFCSLLLRPFKLEFLSVLRQFALSRTEILQPHSSQFQTCTWSITGVLLIYPPWGCARGLKTLVQARYVNQVHLSQEYVQQWEIKPDKTPFYVVLFSMTKTAAKIEALCVLQPRHGNRGYWEWPSVLLQVRTVAAEYFTTLSNQTDLVVSILRIVQQAAVLASKFNS